MKTAALKQTSASRKKLIPVARFKGSKYPQHRDEHRDRYNVDHLPDELLFDWYVRSQPRDAGSPLSRMVCALVEQLAADRGMTLPEAQNTNPIPTWKNI